MSSVLRVPSQIPVRAKYLIVDVSANPGLTAAAGEAFELSGTAMWPAEGRTIMLNTDLNTIALPVNLTQGQLYRDLGRQVVVVDAYSRHLAHFRAAQLVSGAASEGVPADYIPDVYICVWSATAGQVSVSRTG